MKLLDNGELTRVDSSTDTIKKWHDFFSTALPNMGFRDTLLADSYPYAAGIPLITGETMPVSETTGRAFWQMSWADKLAFYWGGAMNGEAFKLIDMYKTMRNFLNNEEVFATLVANIEDAPKKFTKAKRDEFIRDILLDGEVQAMNSEVNSSSPFVDIKFTAAQKTHLYDASCTEEVTGVYEVEYNVRYFVYFPQLNTILDNFPTDILTSSAATSSIGNYFEDYKQLANEDYMCLSLNPIDKLMCSTKQAFSSCISLAKENDIGGTSNTGGLGIPGLFPSDAVYMLFMTSGKHKNMYWEESEWAKDGKERDKTKAYKYLKMTSRSWTYKSKLECLESVEEVMGYESEDTNNFYNSSGLKMPRLQVGRQYCSHGELYWWEDIAEKLLHKNGICTTESQRDDLTKLKALLKAEEGSIIPNIPLCRNNINSCLKKGTMTDNKVIEIDRFGNLRGIYFDNITINWNQSRSSYSNSNKNLVPIKCVAKTGHNRIGSNNQNTGQSKPGLDAFKLMLGIQNYSYYDQNVKICSQCNETIVSDNMCNHMFNGQEICLTCAETMGLIFCEDCGEYHAADEESKHVKYNVQELLHPESFDKYEPMMVCKTKLILTATDSTDSKGSLCIHCGKFHHTGYYQGRFVTLRDFKDITVRVGLCRECYNDAVICDKCRKLVVIDSLENTVILLPGKKVLCRECVDTIRMKKEERLKYKDVMDSLTNALLKEPAEGEQTLEQDVISYTGYDPGITKVTKNLEKQLSGLLYRRDNIEFLEGRPSQDRPDEISDKLSSIFAHEGLPQLLNPVQLAEISGYMANNINQFSYREICKIARAIKDKIISGESFNMHRMRVTRDGEVVDPFMAEHMPVHVSGALRTR